MDVRTYPAANVRRLIIDQAGSDAQVRGEPGATSIQVTYQSGGRETPVDFVVEGETLRFGGAVVMRALLPPDVALTIREASGDLRVQELAGPVALQTVHGDLRLKNLAGTITLGQLDGDVRGEGLADLELTDHCSGDLRLDDVGVMTLAEVAGDLRVHNAGAATVTHTFGDVWFEQLGGALNVNAAEADVRLTEIAGPADLRHVSGDLRAEALLGGLAANHIDGDATLSGPIAAGQNYTLTTDGDIVVALPADADLRLAVRASGRVRSDVQLTPATDGTPSFSAVLGHGTGQMSLSASGDIRITQAGSEGRHHAMPGGVPSDLGERIRRQVNEALSAAGIDPESGEMGAFANFPGGHGAAFTWRGGKFRGRRSWREGGPEMPPGPPPAGPGGAAPRRSTTEEQLRVLKMLEAGTITAEQAEALLAALGG